MNSWRQGTLLGRCGWHRCLMYFSCLLLVFNLAQAKDSALRGMDTDSIPLAKLTAPDKNFELSQKNEKEAESLALFMEASMAEDYGEGDRALELYQKVLNLDPAAKIETPEGKILLAVRVAYELAARKEDLSRSINILKDAIKANPGEVLPYLLLSEIYEKYLKKTDVAIRYANQALSIEPDNFVIYAALYDLYIADKQTRKAEQLLDKAAKLTSTNPQFWLQLGGFYARIMVRDNDKIDQGLQKKANSAFQKALENGKMETGVVSRVADYYMLSQQPEKALSLYQEAAAAQEKANHPQIIQIWEKLAQCYATLQKNDEAITVLQKIVKKSPLHYDAYDLMGSLYEKKEQIEPAMMNYEQALLLDRSQPSNYLRLFEMQLRLGKFEKAIETIQEGRGRFPELPQFTYSLALALGQAGRNQEAVTKYEETVLEAQYSRVDLLNGNFYFNYGAAAEQAGLIEKAAELFRKSIELDPPNAARAYNYMGYMWVDRGENIGEAGELIRKALEMEPDNPSYMDSLGWYYYKNGEYEKALKELLRAASILQPEDPVVFDHIADTYLKLNNVSQAIVYWQKAVTFDPNNQKITSKLEAAKQQITALPALPIQPQPTRQIPVPQAQE